jgi:hypothetical protein
MAVPSPILRKKKNLGGRHGCIISFCSIMVFCNISQPESESESDGQIPVMGTRRFAMLGHFNISRAQVGEQ